MAPVSSEENAESSRLTVGAVIEIKEFFIFAFTPCCDARTNLKRRNKRMTSTKWQWWHVTHCHWVIGQFVTSKPSWWRNKIYRSIISACCPAKLSHLIDKQIPSHSISFRAFLIQLNSIKWGAKPLNIVHTFLRSHIVHRIEYYLQSCDPPFPGNNAMYTGNHFSPCLANWPFSDHK